jgi:hypothetical protein
MGYPCPYKGTPQGKNSCRIDPQTLRGWKGHMSRQHGQFSDEQLAAIVGAAPPDPERGKSLFLSEIDGKPEVPGQNTETRETTGLGGEKQGEPAPEQQKKTVPLKMKKLKKALSTLPATFLKAKGIVPDEDDKEMIDGATEILEEMFGVSLEVPETAWVIRSRLLALLFPLGAMLLIYVKHTFKLKLTVDETKEGEGIRPNGDAEPKLNPNL